MGRILVLLLAIGVASCAPPMPSVEDLAGIDQWREQRATGLQREYGWLSVVGLYWLDEGMQRLGSDPAAEIRLPEGYGPQIAGTIELEDGVLTLRAADGVHFTIDGEPVVERVLRTDAEGDPDLIYLGALRIVALARGDRFALRVRDPASPARRDFAGLEYFDPAPAWRIEARWKPFDPAREVEIPNVLGTTYTGWAPGRAEFEVDGETYSLVPTVENPNDLEEPLFFVFGDKSNGAATYGGGRFLSAAPPRAGHVVLDFNRAVSPPCAFTPHATCPLPLAENRLPFVVPAGEKTYAGAAHHGSAGHSQ